MLERASQIEKDRQRKEQEVMRDIIFSFQLNVINLAFEESLREPRQQNQKRC